MKSSRLDSMLRLMRPMGAGGRAVGRAVVCRPGSSSNGGLGSRTLSPALLVMMVGAAVVSCASGEGGPGDDTRESSAEVFAVNPADQIDPAYVQGGIAFRDAVGLMIWYSGVTGSNANSGCTGTLIDPLHVLTAAHCVAFRTGPSVDGRDSITFYRRDSRSEPVMARVPIVASRAFSAGGDSEEAQKNDVAIVRLAYAVPLTVANPIPIADVVPGVNTLVTAFGFGNCSNSPATGRRLGVKRAAYATFRANGDFRGETGKFWATKQIQVCGVDSGGPWVTRAFPSGSSKIYALNVSHPTNDPTVTMLGDPVQFRPAIADQIATWNTQYPSPLGFRFRRYVPMALYTDDPARDVTRSADVHWKTSFTVQNTGLAFQNITAIAYNANGTEVSRGDISLSAGAGTSFQLNAIGVNADFSGSVELVADGPFAVTAVQTTDDRGVPNRPVVDAAARTSRFANFPDVRRLINNSVTRLFLYNASAFSDNLRFRFYNRDGSVSCDTTRTFKGHAGIEYHLVDQFPGCGLSTNWEGSLSVDAGSGGEIAGAAMQVAYPDGRTTAYEAVQEGGASNQSLPSVLCRRWGTSSQATLMNLEDHAVPYKITYSDAGGPRPPVQGSLAPHQVVQLDACNWTPVGFLGSAKLSTDNVHDRVATINSVFRDDFHPNFEATNPAIHDVVESGWRFSLPYIRSTQLPAANDRPVTNIAIQNESGDPVDVTVRYFDTTGERGAHLLTIPGFAKGNSNPAAAGLIEFGYAPTFGGSAIVEGPPGARLGVLVRVSGADTAEDYGGVPTAL